MYIVITYVYTVGIALGNCYSYLQTTMPYIYQKEF